MSYPENGIKRLVEICSRKGIDTIVISPGSRNAPVITSFSDHPKMKCISIVDERSAAFFALGIAQQTKKTVALACTSGTASLNFAPAIAEAYYQKISLLILTADRPVEWIDQSDNQTIKQNNIYANYINKSFQFPQSIYTEDERWYYDRISCEAIDLCEFPRKGPVHINLPFTEPLYGFPVTDKEAKIISTLKTKSSVDKSTFDKLIQKWNSFSKKLIVCGMQDPDESLNSFLSGICKNSGAVVITETTSNLDDENFISGIDKILSAIPEDQTENYKPELLITFGMHVVSKKIKVFLRDNAAVEHWHIDKDDLFTDTYQSLTLNIPITPSEFFKNIANAEGKNHDKVFLELWQEASDKANKGHDDYLLNCEYTDLKAFQLILNAVPSGSNLHLGNSTPIRYAQLFETNPEIKYNSNRGTSGIDGTVSTTTGAAYINRTPTTLITGDLGFFYDSNGLWNHYLDSNLRIIIINNQGGGIFRFIDGPSETEVLEDLFETKHNTKADGIAKTFGLKYFSANNTEELEVALRELYHKDNDTPSILEVFTPNKINAEVLKAYFNFIKHSNK